MSFVNKTFSMTHMKRTRSHNRSRKAAYLKQCNHCVSILRKTKRKYYGNINERDIVDNKQF